MPANLHVTYLLFLCSVNENRTSSTYFSKNLKCKISRKSVRVFDLIQADEWTDCQTYDETNLRFSLANALKIMTEKDQAEEVR